MLGAIIGDIVGSRYEFHNHLSKDFDLFAPSCTYTDDTVMTCAVADLWIRQPILYLALQCKPKTL